MHPRTKRSPPTFHCVTMIALETSAISMSRSRVLSQVRLSGIPVTIARMVLEVAVSTVDDAVVAHAAGADRIELCAALEVGGATPSLGTLIEVKRAVPIPVMVMIRPRAGHFTYSAREFQTMRRDA